MKALFRCLLVAFALPMVFASCGDDAEAENPTIIEPVNITCATGATQTVSFQAAQAWTLTVDQVWCKFVVGDKLQEFLTGNAGSQQVTIKVGSEGLTNEKSGVAYITLHSAGKNAIIASVVRPAAGYELQVFDAAGKEVKELVVGYDDYTPFSVKANFSFAATAMPDWAGLRNGYLVGTSNRMATSGIRFLTDGEREKYEQQDSLVFKDEQGKASFSVKLIFPGMPKDVVAITRPDNASAWNWCVAADGKNFTQSGSSYQQLTFSITAYHDDYEVVMVQKAVDGTLTVGDVTWLHWNQRLQRLTADANEASTAREAYVLVFSRQQYEEICSDLASAILDGNDLAHGISENNLLVALTQEAAKKDEPGISTGEEVGFWAESFFMGEGDDQYMVKVECFNIIDDALLNYCEQTIGTRKVFLLEEPSQRENGNFDVITPYPLLLYRDDWDDGLAYFANYDGTEMDDNYPELNYNDADKPYHWTVGGVTNSEEGKPYFLVMLDTDKKTITKALLIKTKKK